MQTIHIYTGVYHYQLRKIDGGQGEPQWFSVSHIYDNDELVDVIYHEMSSVKFEAAAALVGDVSKKSPDKMIVVHPHHRSYYLEGKHCECALCELINAGHAASNVFTEKGSIQSKKLFNSADYAAESVVRNRIAQAKKSSYQWSENRFIPCRAEFDEKGRLVNREIRAKVDSASVWTDASLGSSAVIGFGCVNDKMSRKKTGFVRKKSGNRNARILFGELSAISAAIDEWAGSANKIKIFTDSKHARNHISRQVWHASDVDVTRILQEIRRQIESYESIGGGIEVVWTPGHKGEIHNEAAHRLANTARREHEWGIDREIACKQELNILRDRAIS